MKKSLIAVAVAGLFAAPAAMAEVTLSGAINLGINLSKVGSGTAPGSSSLTTTSLNAHYSHIDLESVDDIGGGNKVIFHYQMQVNPESTSGNPFNRNSFLGVAGGWGAFKMGTNENVYERFMYTADPIDGALGPGGNLNILGTPGAGAVFQAGQNIAVVGPQVDFYRRTDQTIWYESPNFAGFNFEIDYTLGAFKTASTPTTPSIDPRVLSIGGKFQPEGAPFYVDLAYEEHKDMFGLDAIAAASGLALTGTSTGSKDTGIQIGGGFMIGDLGLNLRYERLKYTDEGTGLTVSEYKRDAYWFGVKYNLPSGYVGAELGIARDGKTNAGTASDTGAKMFGVGYFHNLSKQSQLQFIYGRTDNKDNATYGHAGAVGPVTPGADSQVFRVGLKHTF
jgi:predicted porin